MMSCLESTQFFKFKPIPELMVSAFTAHPKVKATNNAKEREIEEEEKE